MTTIRGRRAAILCAGGVVAVAGSLASALALTASGPTARAAAGTPALVAFEQGPPGGCNDPPGSQGVAGTSTKACQGAGSTVEVGQETDQISQVKDANVSGSAEMNGVTVSQGPVGKVVSM